MLGIDRAVDRGREDNATAFLQPTIGCGPGRRVGREVRAGDGDETAAGREARKRRGDMAEGGVDHPALDIGHDGERRVHQHDGWQNAGVEMIVDLRRVEAGDRQGRKEKRKKTGAGLGEFVENE